MFLYQEFAKDHELPKFSRFRRYNSENIIYLDLFPSYCFRLTTIKGCQGFEYITFSLVLETDTSHISSVPDPSRW